MAGIPLPTIDHPDFPPGSPETSWGQLPAPPPEILSAMAGPRPYMPVLPTSLKVGDRIATISYVLYQWRAGTITKIRVGAGRNEEGVLFISTDGPTSIPGHLQTYAIRPEPVIEPEMRWVYRLNRQLKPDEAKGLSELSTSRELPYDVTANIREAITGVKPRRFRPDSKTGGKTRRAKGRKYRKQVGRPSTRRVR
jgi:hypothetical protein